MANGEQRALPSDFPAIPIDPEVAEEAPVEPPDLGEFAAVQVGAPIEAPPDLGEFEPVDVSQAPIERPLPAPIPLVSAPVTQPKPEIGETFTLDQARKIAATRELSRVPPEVLPEIPALQPVAPAPELADFAPAAVTPAAPVSALSETITEKAGTLAEQSAVAATMGARKNQLQREFALATTDKERAKLGGQLEAANAADLDARTKVADTRDELDADRAVQQATLAVAANDARQRAALNAGERIDEERADLAQKLSANQQRIDKASQERNQAVASYQRVLEKGPPQSTGVMITSIIGEALRARNTKTEPNFAQAVGQWERMNRQVWKDQQTASIQKVTTTGDRITDEAAKGQILRADSAERQAAIMTRAQRDTELLISRTTNEAAKAELSAVRDDLARHAEAKQAEAAAARTKALRDEEDRELDLADKRAALALKRASVQEKLSKVRRRGGGRGRGAGKEEAIAPGLVPIAATVVPLPGTNDVLAKFEDTKEGRAAARKAREFATNYATSLRLVNEYIAEVDVNGSKGLFDDENWATTPEGAELRTKQAFLAGTIALILAGEGTPSDVHDKTAITLVPQADSLWDRQTEGTAAAGGRSIRKEIETRARETAGLAQLTPAQANRMISDARPISQGQATLIREQKTGKGIARQAVAETAGLKIGEIATRGRIRSFAEEQAQEDFGSETRWKQVLPDFLEGALAELHGKPSTAETKRAIEQLGDQATEAISELEREIKGSLTRTLDSGATIDIEESDLGPDVLNGVRRRQLAVRELQRIQRRNSTEWKTLLEPAQTLTPAEARARERAIERGTVSPPRGR